MKPVQLIPVGLGSSSASAVDLGPAVPVAPPSANGTIAIIAAGVVALGIAGYFELSLHTGKVKTAADLSVQAATATQQTTDIQAQITQRSGTVNDWAGTAQAVSTTVISAAGDRHPYGNLMRDLRRVITPELGAWLTSVDTSSGDSGAAPTTPASGSSQTVTLIGHAPTWGAVAALLVRVNAAPSMSDAQLNDFSLEKTKKKQQYIKFTITAALTDAAAATSTGADASSATVGTTSGGSSASEIALDPEPGFSNRAAAAKLAAKAKADAAKAAKAAAAPKPLTPLEQAAKAAGAVGGNS